jgi:hypothetical protein
MKAKHFYPEEQRNGSWRIWLIDCEGVYRWSSERDRRREWETFLSCFATNAPALHDALSEAYARATNRGSELRRSA